MEVVTVPAPARVVVVPVERQRSVPITGVQVGGGVASFTRREMSAVADNGPMWDARVVVGTRRLLAFEAAYVGAAYPLEAGRFGPDAFVVRNGVETAARLNLPVVTGNFHFSPFAFGGLGWGYYQLAGATVTGPQVVTGDNVATVPVGGGLSFGYDRFLLEARYTYRMTFRDELLAPPTTPREERLRDTSLSAQVGYEF
jgi:hypothetical protein